MSRSTKLLGAIAAVAVSAAVSLGVIQSQNDLSACGFDVCVGDSWQSKYLAADISQGDAILTVQDGVHPTQVLRRDTSKVGSSNRVVFASVPGGAGVVVQALASGISGGSVVSPTGAANVELRGLITINKELTVLWGSDNWLVTRVKAANIRLQSVAGVTVRNSEFGPYVDQVATINKAGNGAPAPRDILIDTAYFHDYLISDPVKHAECMQIWPTGATNITLRNVWMRNCTDFGVLVKAPSTTNVVFESVSIDKPMPGTVATVECNPNCARGGTSLRFSSYEYPGSAVRNSKLGGNLGIDKAGFVEVTNTCTNCDPGPVPDVMANCVAPDLSWSSPTRDTLTVTWANVPGSSGYRLTKDGVPSGNLPSSATSYIFTGLPYGSSSLGVASICPSGDAVSYVSTSEVRTANAG